MSIDQPTPETHDGAGREAAPPAGLAERRAPASVPDGPDNARGGGRSSAGNYAAVKAERERHAYIAGLVEALEGYLRRGDGLRLPNRQRRVLEALVALQRRMGRRLGYALELDASIRDLSELAGMNKDTVVLALKELHEADMLVRVDKASGNRAARWGAGKALMVAALNGSRPNVANPVHTTPLATSFTEGVPPARESDVKTRGVVCTASATASDAPLVSDAFTYGQAALGGLGENARKMVDALRGGPLAPAELTRRLGCSRTTTWRVLRRLEHCGIVERVGREVVLDEAELGRACRETTRREAQREAYAFQRKEWSDWLAEHDDWSTWLVEHKADDERVREHMRRHHERRRQGLPVASAFADSAPAEVEVTPTPTAPDWAATARASEAKRPVVVPILEPAATKPPLVVPTRAEWEESRRRLAEIAARSGVRTDQASARRPVKPPPSCPRHGEGWWMEGGRCSRCAMVAEIDGAAPTLAVALSDPLRPHDDATWTKAPIPERTPLEIAEERAALARRRREAA